MYSLQVRGSEFLQKLEDKFQDGNEEVIEFFQLLGDKVGVTLKILKMRIR